MNSNSTLEAVIRFNEAFNRHDVDAVMAAMTDDCVFENTSPAPDGTRVVGSADVLEYWKKFFSISPDALFETEEIVAFDDRCVVRWVYTKIKNGQPWRFVVLISSALRMEKSPRNFPT